MEISSFPYRAGFGFENPAGNIHGFTHVVTGTKAFMAYLECLCDIDAIHVFATLLFECCLIYDFHAEIVQDHSASNFLHDKSVATGTEFFRAQDMLQVAEVLIDDSIMFR